MIDIHSHILPMVDDGAEDVNTALDMLKHAAECGTEGIVLTPHFAANRNYINKKEKIKVLFSQLCNIKDHYHIPVKLYPGSEYMMLGKKYYVEDRHHIMTMNNTDYLLIEFPFNVTEDELFSGTKCILEDGFIPIVAHPERYHTIHIYPEICGELIREGALFQMNKGSISGDFGKQAEETSLYLLRHRAYAFAGSDAHNSYNRNPDMIPAFNFIKDYCNSKYANMLFRHNPEFMLENTDIRGLMKYEKY